MKIYIFGNGNISLGEFLKSYVTPLKNLRPSKKVSFLLCDFRGLDTLMMEYLKTESGDVSIYHIGEKPGTCR